MSKIVGTISVVHSWLGAVIFQLYLATWTVHGVWCVVGRERGHGGVDIVSQTATNDKTGSYTKDTHTHCRTKHALGYTQGSRGGAWLRCGAGRHGDNMTFPSYTGERPVISPIGGDTDGGSVRCQSEISGITTPSALESRIPPSDMLTTA